MYYLSVQVRGAFTVPPLVPAVTVPPLVAASAVRPLVPAFTVPSLVASSAVPPLVPGVTVAWRPPTCRTGLALFAFTVVALAPFTALPLAPSAPRHQHDAVLLRRLEAFATIGIAR